MTLRLSCRRDGGDECRVFALAFSAAPNPKLLALDLLLIENRRTKC